MYPASSEYMSQPSTPVFPYSYSTPSLLGEPGFIFLISIAVIILIEVLILIAVLISNAVLIFIAVLILIAVLIFITVMTIPTNVTNNTVSDNTVNNKEVTTTKVITSAPQSSTSSIYTINWVFREYLNNHTSSNIFLYIDDIIVHDEEPSQQ